MENEYVKLWTSYSAYFEPLGDAEVGRLARAMIAYKSNGVEPKFSGNERFVWPAIKRDMDIAEQAYAAYREMKSECGSKGGRPKKANGFSENQKKLEVFSESKKSQGKRIKDKGQREKEAADAREDFSDLYDKNLAQVVQHFESVIGYSIPQPVVSAVMEWLKTMPADLICAAIDEAVKANARNWNYAAACLRAWNAKGIRTLDALKAAQAARQKPEKPKEIPRDEKSYDVLAAFMEDDDGLR